jgi:guanylate kinase
MARERAQRTAYSLPLCHWQEGQFPVLRLQMEPRLPQVLLLDGATGTGKSLVLQYLRDEYRATVHVGAKFTTRKRRAGDNDWEFKFVESIPDSSRQYSYSSVGNEYAVDPVDLATAARHGKLYATTCVDPSILRRIAADFRTIVVYCYRPMTAAGLLALLATRGTRDPEEVEHRRKEVESVVADYQRRIALYNHVLLNLEGHHQLRDQVSSLLRHHGIAPDRTTN